VKRRNFITLLGGTAAWPLAARAQQAGRLPTIGFLGASTLGVEGHRNAVLVQRLRELGWIEGRSIAIEYRWAEGRNEHFAEIAAEFVRLKVDVIVTYGTAPTLAAKQATAVIPIVFAVSGDPVGTGLVASLARPGGNVTGLSGQQTDSATKRIELLREVQTAAHTLGLQVNILEVQQAQDIAPAFNDLKGRVDALYVVGDPLVNTNRIRINILAVGAGLPTIYLLREYVEAGGLLSFGPNILDLYRRAAGLVDKILRGAKAADLPVEQPTKFDLIINLTTAKALGLTIPESFLARADEVIE